MVDISLPRLHAVQVGYQTRNECERSGSPNFPPGLCASPAAQKQEIPAEEPPWRRREWTCAPDMCGGGGKAPCATRKARCYEKIWSHAPPSGGLHHWVRFPERKTMVRKRSAGAQKRGRATGGKPPGGAPPYPSRKNRTQS